MTDENKEKINKIVREHLDTIDVLRVVDYPIQDKAQLIYKEFLPLYKKLDAEKLLPENCTWEVFNQLLIPRLEQEATFSLMRAQFHI